VNATLAQELSLRSVSNIARIAAMALLFAIMYLPVFADLHAKYSAIDSYYGHGYLIPLVSAFAVWLRRHRLKRMEVVPFPPGLGVLGGGLLLYFASRWLYVNVAADLSAVIVLAGLSLYLFGKAITRELMFPLAFLLFMIPLPKISIIYITFWLKLFVASAATEAVSAMGVPVLLRGAFIELPTGAIEIDNACSGLRSLIALMAMGVAYASFLPVSFLRKTVVVLFSIPIAIAANLIRILVLIWVSYLYSPTGKAFEMTDFTTGMLVYAIALMGLIAVSQGATAWQRRWMNGRLSG